MVKLGRPRKRLAMSETANEQPSTKTNALELEHQAETVPRLNDKEPEKTPAVTEKEFHEAVDNFNLALNSNTAEDDLDGFRTGKMDKDQLHDAPAAQPNETTLNIGPAEGQFFTLNFLSGAMPCNVLLDGKLPLVSFPSRDEFFYLKSEVCKLQAQLNAQTQRYSCLTERLDSMDSGCQSLVSTLVNFKTSTEQKLEHLLKNDQSATNFKTNGLSTRTASTPSSNANSSSSSSSQRIDRLCSYGCGQRHLPSQCQTFGTREARLEQVILKNLCIVCLKDKGRHKGECHALNCPYCQHNGIQGRENLRHHQSLCTHPHYD